MTEKAPKKAKRNTSRSTSSSNKMADQGTSGKRPGCPVADSIASTYAGSQPKMSKYEKPRDTRIDLDGYYIDGEMKYPYPNDDDLILISTKKHKFSIFVNECA